MCCLWWICHGKLYPSEPPAWKDRCWKRKKIYLSRDPYNLNWSYLTPWEYVTCTAYQRRQHWTCTRVIVLFINNTQWPVSIYVYRTAKPYSNSAPRDIHLFSLRISIFFLGFCKYSLPLAPVSDALFSHSLFLSTSLSFALPLVFFSGRMSVPHSAGDLNTVVLKLGILLLHVFHSFSSITHNKHTQYTNKGKKKKKQTQVTVQFILGYGM